MVNIFEAEQSSSDNQDFDLSFTGLIVAKPIIFALF